MNGLVVPSTEMFSGGFLSHPSFSPSSSSPQLIFVLRALNRHPTSHQIDLVCMCSVAGRSPSSSIVIPSTTTRSWWLPDWATFTERGERPTLKLLYIVITHPGMVGVGRRRQVVKRSRRIGRDPQTTEHQKMLLCLAECQCRIGEFHRRTVTLQGKEEATCCIPTKLYEVQDELLLVQQLKQ